MTRFTYKGDVTWGRNDQNSIHIRTTGRADFKSFASKAGDAVVDGALLLQNALTAISRKTVSSEMNRYANRYFLTGKKLDATDINTIKSVITKTLNGISSDTMGVKIVKSDPTVNGSVNGMRVGNAPKLHSQPYHNNVADMSDGTVWRQSAIHITGDRLGLGRLGVQTLIHEATHKYAGTEDYCYFSYDGSTPSGTFTDKKRALQNADSYAWFVLKVGRGGGLFRSTMYS